MYNIISLLCKLLARGAYFRSMNFTIDSKILDAVADEDLSLLAELIHQGIESMNIEIESCIVEVRSAQSKLDANRFKLKKYEDLLKKLTQRNVKFKETPESEFVVWNRVLATTAEGQIKKESTSNTLPLITDTPHPYNKDWPLSKKAAHCIGISRKELTISEIIQLIERFEPDVYLSKNLDKSRFRRNLGSTLKQKIDNKRDFYRVKNESDEFIYGLK